MNLCFKRIRKPLCHHLNSNSPHDKIRHYDWLKTFFKLCYTKQLLINNITYPSLRNREVFQNYYYTCIINYSVSGKLLPRKITPRSGSGFGLGLALELVLGGNFPRGQSP